MRVGAPLGPAQQHEVARPSPPAARAASSVRTYVEPERTPVTRVQIREAIARAHVKLTGKAASSDTLDVLTAHASLETASGARMYNHNFGGIKGTSPGGQTAVCRTKEVLGGREVEVRDGFRAYATLDEGARDYLALMRSRFGKASAAAEAGDARAFAHELKAAGYYTANESDYVAGMLAQMGVTPAPQHAAPSVAKGGTTREADELPTLEAWSRVLDTAMVSSAAAIAAPLEADERD